MQVIRCAHATDRVATWHAERTNPSLILTAKLDWLYGVSGPQQHTRSDKDPVSQQSADEQLTSSRSMCAAQENPTIPGIVGHL